MPKIANWLTQFENEYKLFMSVNKQDRIFFSNYSQDFYTFRELYSVYYPRLLEMNEQEAPGFSLMYHLHAGLTTYYKMIETLGNTSSYQINSYIQEIVSEIAEICFELRELTINDDELQGFLKQSISRFDKLLDLEQTYEYDSLYLYRVIWSSLLGERALIDQQRNRLQTNEQYLTSYKVALAHLDYMELLDDAAIRHIDSLPSEKIYLSMLWIGTLVTYEQWERAKPWFTFIIKKMTLFINDATYTKRKQDATEFFLYHLEKYAHETKDVQLLEHAFEQWMPYSYSYYQLYLLEAKQFRKWIELQIDFHISPNQIDKSILKNIEQHDREVLLPLYHQNVVKLIEQKNRQAYREAVKYLRKLRTHYRQLKQLPVWDTYITALAAKYKRLRAFQDELRKGRSKLIND